MSRFSGGQVDSKYGIHLKQKIILTRNKTSDELHYFLLDAQILRTRHFLQRFHRVSAYVQTIDHHRLTTACFLPNQGQQGLNTVLKLF